METSNKGSSNSTGSPTCLSQVLTVPSVTVSPSFGIVMSCTSPTGEPTEGSSPAIPSEPPIDGAAGSASEGPPAAATLCDADGSRFSTTAPTAPIRTRGVPTGTVSPDATRISTTTPSYGLGISESTLSVDTSNSGSSKATSSPACLNQFVISPSVTVSPSLGMVTTHSSSLIAITPGDQPCNERPEKVIMVSPMASERLGCAWMSLPTSSGSASQLTAR